METYQEMGLNYQDTCSRIKKTRLLHQVNNLVSLIFIATISFYKCSTLSLISCVLP